MGLFTKEVKPKSCRNCSSYGVVKSEDTVNPDKTITKGKIDYEFCFKGKFYLEDYKACDLHREGTPTARLLPPPYLNKPERAKRNV